MKKILRSIQVFFPFLQNLKYALRFQVMKKLGQVHEEDFKIMQWFRPGQGQVFIDIGANRGEAITSMQIMNQWNQEIIGFEPNEEIFERLKRYLAGHKNVRVYNLGLGKKQKNSPLYVPIYRNWLFDGLASFRYQNAKDWLEDRLFGYRRKHLNIKKTTCEIRKLDDFDLRPYFIKIDVQGYELEVLQGAKNTIKTQLPILLIESLEDHCVDFLKEFGYQFYHYRQGALHSGKGHPNTFCLHLENHSELSEAVG